MKTQKGMDTHKLVANIHVEEVQLQIANSISHNNYCRIILFIIYELFVHCTVM